MSDQISRREGANKLIDSIMADSKVHRKLGLWAIDSVNGNSWSSGSKFLEFTGADIVLFQETKLRGDDLLRSAEDTAGRLGWELSLGKVALGAKGGASVGMGITVRKNMGIAMPDGISDIDFESRFLLRKLGARCKGGIHTGTIYMHTMVGPTGPKKQKPP